MARVIIVEYEGKELGFTSLEKMFRSDKVLSDNRNGIFNAIIRNKTNYDKHGIKVHRIPLNP